MNVARSSSSGDSPGVDALRLLMVSETQRLLGATIAVTDEQWREGSRLPGWTRGHVATHVARQADALVRLIQGALTETPTPMYSSPDQREDEINAGAARPGVELQSDLDSSAEALAAAFDRVADASAWDVVVELRGGTRAPLRLLPLARLSEVVLHHVDLDVGTGVDDIAETTADRLLEWLALRLGSRNDFPRVRVRSSSGLVVVIGGQGAVTEVSGGSAQLLGWLTGRSGSRGVSGAEALTLPPL